MQQQIVEPRQLGRIDPAIGVQLLQPPADLGIHHARPADCAPERAPHARDRVAAGLDQPGQHLGGQAVAAVAGLQHHLRENLCGDIFAGLVIEHLHWVAGLDQRGDAIEGDVLLAVGMVELAIGVFFDRLHYDGIKLSLIQPQAGPQGCDHQPHA